MSEEFAEGAIVWAFIWFIVFVAILVLYTIYGNEDLKEVKKKDD